MTVNTPIVNSSCKHVGKELQVISGIVVEEQSHVLNMYHLHLHGGYKLYMRILGQRIM